MVVDIEQIREEEFVRFRKAVKKFYKGRENEYFEQFQEKIQSGEIDPDCTDYKEICLQEAQDFMSTRPSKLLKFVQDYVDERSSEVLDAVTDGTSCRGRAKVQLEVLKAVLLAGEEDSQRV
jgi:hypothetical protein